MREAPTARTDIVDVHIPTTAGEAVDPLSILLEDTLATMKLGGTCEVSSIPPSLVSHAVTPPGSSISYTLHVRSFKRSKECWEMADGELLLLAQQQKDRGTRLYKEGDIRGAAVCYSRGAQYVIPIKPGTEERERLRVALFLNLAACQLKLGQNTHVVDNCSKVLAQEPNNVKALYRRGVASKNIGDLDQAWEDLLAARRLEPGNRAVQEQLREVGRRRQVQDAKLGNALKSMFGRD